MIATPLVIFGGKGMLGQELAMALKDYEPVVWDREECDITSSKDVTQKLSKISARVIINAAAYNFVDAAETEPGRSLADAVNVAGPRNLARVAYAQHATLVHYSTDYVFDGRNTEGYREDAVPNPQSHYAMTKWRGEEAVRQSHARAYIIRTCKIFGKPAASRGGKKSFVDVMLAQAKEKKDVYVIDDEYASPTYAPDLAQQTRFLLETNSAPGIYHITNTHACTWYTFAKEIFRLANISVNLHPVSEDFYDRAAKRPHSSELLNTKLPSLRSWQEALAAYLQSCV